MTTRPIRSQLEGTLSYQLRVMGCLDDCRPEYRFAAHAVGGTGKGLRARLLAAGLRDWRFDLAWPDARLAVEIEGGIYVGGRHTRGKGFEDDLEKYHHANALGWTLYRCGSKLVKSGEAAQLIAKLLAIKTEGDRHEKVRPLPPEGRRVES